VPFGLVIMDSKTGQGNKMAVSLKGKEEEEKRWATSGRGMMRY